MANAREPFQIRGVESKKVEILSCFYNQRVFEIYHDSPPYFSPAEQAIRGKGDRDRADGQARNPGTNENEASTPF